MDQRSIIRASDGDREEIAERLRVATTEGRISAEELDDRLGTLYAAQTYGQLDALVADLPAPVPAAAPPAQRGTNWPAWAGGAAVLAGMLTLLSAASTPIHQSAFATGGPPGSDRAQAIQNVPLVIGHSHPSLMPALTALGALVLGLAFVIGLCIAVGRIVASLSDPADA